MSSRTAKANSLPFHAFTAELFTASPLRNAITSVYRRDEREAVAWLLSSMEHDAQWTQASQDMARRLVQGVRQKRTRSSGVDALMQEFSLSSEEGVALMCLAEALLRIPDSQTADRLIADKIGKGDWRRHLGESPSLFVNAATWGLMVTGKLVGSASEKGMASALTRLVNKGGEPLIRKGMDLAMRMLGNQFVTGRSISEALQNSLVNEKRGYRYSYDMLGEAALTDKDAANYYQSYENAIHTIGRASNGRGIKDGPGISVKLSALHPRYVRGQRQRVISELLPRLKKLLLLAKQYDIGLNIDAEEADRLELSLDLMALLVADPDLAGFEGLGFVVQAYQKRCPFVIDYLIDLARSHNRKLMIRLVKGAYWDAEIKRAQVDGLPGYPVYTRKVYTDVSYLACAQKLLAATDVIYPQFATHNAHTLSAVWHWAEKRGVTDFEFQCLHGMGESLYDQVVGKDALNKPCRIYAPVGSHETLLAYLVRRLLENGANSSFVNQIVDEAVPVDALVTDPVAASRSLAGEPHRQIVLPRALYGVTRVNSPGLDLSDEQVLHTLAQALTTFSAYQWHATPLLGVPATAGASLPVNNPAQHHDIVGSVVETAPADVQAALGVAVKAASGWANTPPADRARILQQGADLLEQHMPELMALAIREAGKSLPNAIAEVREAIDFLRYYAVGITLGKAGQALGPVVCISPWNFPLAIFIGEVSAALAAGNVVLAKPAEQTPLIAFRAVGLLHAAGVPRDVLQFVPGSGETVGAVLTSDARVNGVIFTGSTEVAQSINQTLAKRVVSGCDIALIAETGGQNALIVDSSALPEQVVQDVLMSAFDSAGQRCSALRVLCLQEDIADRTLEMLRGAMRELRVGNPDRLATDIGPVIDAEARDKLLAHIARMRQNGHVVHQLPLPKECGEGTFVPPTIIEIEGLSQLAREVFGPVLHVLRYRRDRLPQLVHAINETGYGLTLGVHSRIDETVAYVAAHAHVGNIYVNRNIVGAVVGVQPFGGEGKSGTGPKAGGPLYVKRLQRDAEPALSVMPAAQGQPLLAVLASWAQEQGNTVLAGLCHLYGKTSLLGATLMLPGPTGERNTQTFAPRGKIACIANHPVVLLNQIAAVLATGNQAIVELSLDTHLPQDLPQAVLDAISVRRCASEPGLHLALVDNSVLEQWYRPLAQRDGALVPVVPVIDDQPVPLWRLVAERALCINTTAAGGNASLMSLTE